MTTAGKHMIEPPAETSSPFVAQYAWMTSDAKEDWECGMRNALPEMPDSIREAIQTLIHGGNSQDSTFEDA